MRASFQRWLAALLLLTSMVVAGDAWAQGRPPPGPRPVPTRSAQPVSGKVKVEVMVVHATNSHNRVDPQLKPVMQQLRFTQYKGFQRLDNHPASLAVGEETSFSIAGNRKVHVELLERDEREAKVRIRMSNQQGKVLDTTVSIHRNRSFMISGPKYEDGVLILPVTVSY